MQSFLVFFKDIFLYVPYSSDDSTFMAPKKAILARGRGGAPILYYLCIACSESSKALLYHNPEKRGKQRQIKNNV